MTSPERLAVTEEAAMSVSPLDDSSITSALITLEELLETSYGCNGSTKVIHNNSGGHVTVTSTCARMLSALSVSKPCVKLITTAIQSHLNQHSDGGHLTGLMALYLINNTLKNVLNRHLVTDIFEHMLEASLTYLGSDCECKVKIDNSHINDLLSLIKTVFSSKPGCCLCFDDEINLSRLVLRAIISSHSAPHSIQYLLREGAHPSSSDIIDGILISAPQFPNHVTKSAILDLPGSSSISVALVSTSLSGDSEDFIDATYELTGCKSTVDATVELLVVFVEQLAKYNVKVLLAQKVVHPLVKKRLRELDILTLERLGLGKIKAAQVLCGGNLIGSFMAQIDTHRDLGMLKVIHHKVIDEKSYVHLEGDSGRVSTLILSHWSENSLDETKHVCQTAEHLVRQTWQCPWVMKGGGQWQHSLAEHLRRHTIHCVEDWAHQVGCNRTQAQVAVDVFISCLDKITSLLKKQPTSQARPDGSLQVDSELLDSYQVCTSALRLGVNMACAVLQIHTCITQK